MRFFSAVFLAFFVTSCVSKQCRNQGGALPPVSEKEMKEVTLAHEKVKVYKPDGSLQCGMGKQIDIEEMQKELTDKNILVFSSQNKPDGLMHIAMCGAATGNSHIFVIDREHLESAKKLGFREWTQD